MRLDDVRLDRLRRSLDEPDLFGTHYRLVGPLGRGGMGSVWDVEDERLGRRVALKVLAVTDDDGSLARRLLDEARIIAGLEHPGIVPIHDAGTLADGRVYYVMKRVRGRPLADVADQLPFHDALAILRRVCDAVGFAHANGVVHRDLKPSNIMLGEFGVTLVLDWGVAKRIATSGDALAASERGTRPAATPAVVAGSGRADTRAGTRIGTHGYMAPEQERGETSLIGPATDVFGLGRVLAFLAERATTTAPPIQRRPLNAIIAKATAAAPAARYTDATQLGRDVARLAAGHAVLAYPEGPLLRARRALAPHTTAIVLLATYILLRVVLILTGRP